MAVNQATQQPPRMGTTEELAAQFHVQEKTVRHSLCTKGHYCGLRPVKLPNRLLLWNMDDAQKILSGQKLQQSGEVRA